MFKNEQKHPFYKPLWVRVARRYETLHILQITQGIAAVLCLASYWAPGLVSYWALSMAMFAFKSSYLLNFPYLMRTESDDTRGATIGLLSVTAHLGVVLGAVVAHALRIEGASSGGVESDRLGGASDASEHGAAQGALGQVGRRDLARGAVGTRTQRRHHHGTAVDALPIARVRHARLVGVHEAVPAHRCDVQFEVALHCHHHRVGIDLSDECAKQGRLTRAHSPTHHDVEVGLHRRTQQCECAVVEHALVAQVGQSHAEDRCTAHGDQRPLHHIETLAVKANSRLQFEVDEGLFTVEHPTSRRCRVVDDSFEVAIASHQRRQELPRPVGALHAHGVGTKHQHIGHQRVPQHSEQPGQTEDLRHHEIGDGAQFFGGERVEPLHHPLVLHFGKHHPLQHVSCGHFALFPFQRRFIPRWQRKPVAPFAANVGGQTVEVVTAKEGGPSRDWLNPELGFLVSPRARNKVRSWFNGDRALILAIYRQPGSNTVEVVQKLKEMLPEI